MYFFQGDMFGAGTETSTHTILFAIMFLSVVAFHHHGTGESKLANVTIQMREEEILFAIVFFCGISSFWYW